MAVAVAIAAAGGGFGDRGGDRGGRGGFGGNRGGYGDRGGNRGALAATRGNGPRRSRWRPWRPATVAASAATVFWGLRGFTKPRTARRCAPTRATTCHSARHDQKVYALPFHANLFAPAALAGVPKHRRSHSPNLQKRDAKRGRFILVGFIWANVVVYHHCSRWGRSF